MSVISNKRHLRIIIFAGLVVGFCFVVLFARGATGTLLAEDAPQHLTTLDWGKKWLAPDEETVVQREPTQIEGTVANCRYGLATIGEGQLELVDDFGAGTYIDFGHRSLPADNMAQYIPKIAMSEGKNGCEYLGTYTTQPSILVDDPTNPLGLRFWLERHPGRLWLIGNEVDRGPDETGGGCESSQDDMQPETYARALHDTIEYIRKYDPTAQTSIAGLVQITPGRLQYLDIVWNTHKDLYGNPPDIDAFVIHLYILPEATPTGEENNIAAIANGTNPALAIRESGGNPALCADPNVYCYAEHDNMSVFAEQVVAMRTWMKNKGVRQKPLILTEYSLLYPYIDDGGTCFIQDEYGNCFTEDRVRTFMANSFSYMENAVDPNLGYTLDGNRLIQQWIWFSINHGDAAGSVSNLYNDDGNGNLTNIRALGQDWINHVYSISTYVNLLPDRASYPSVRTDGTNTADVDIWITFRNNGITHVHDTFNVSFYSNSSLTNLIGTATIDMIEPVAGCAQSYYKATVTWNDLTPGRHRYWAKVDSQNIIGESKEFDNVIQGAVYVDMPVQFLPINHR